jgi:hypothetical protein
VIGGDTDEIRDQGLQRIAQSPAAADLARTLRGLEAAATELSQGVEMQQRRQSAAISRAGRMPTWLRRSGIALAAGLFAFALFSVPRPVDVQAPAANPAATQILNASFEGSANEQVFSAGFDS